MATTGQIEKNERRKKLTARHKAKRAALKKIASDKSASPEERFQARMKLNQMPRNGAAIRVRNRCAMTGRARGNYRKFGISRLMLRDLASKGEIPGVVKASW